MNRLRRLFPARSDKLDVDRLAARIEAVDRTMSNAEPSMDEDALARLAASIRLLGDDAPTPTDATALRRVVLARAAGARGQATRRRLATTRAAVLIAVAAAIAMPAWVPHVGSALGPIVEWLWHAPVPEGPDRPEPTHSGPSDGGPSSPPIIGPSIVPPAGPSAEPDGPPGPTPPDDPWDSPGFASPVPPANPPPTPTLPAASPPGRTSPPVSPPLPTQAVTPPVPSPVILPPPSSGQDPAGA